MELALMLVSLVRVALWSSSSLDLYLALNKFLNPSLKLVDMPLSRASTRLVSISVSGNTTLLKC